MWPFQSLNPDTGSCSSPADRPPVSPCPSILGHSHEMPLLLCLQPAPGQHTQGGSEAARVWGAMPQALRHPSPSSSPTLHGTSVLSGRVSHRIAPHSCTSAAPRARECRVCRTSSLLCPGLIRSVALPMKACDSLWQQTCLVLLLDRPPFPVGTLGDAIRGEHLAELALRVVALLAKPACHTQHLLPAPSTLPGFVPGQAPAGGSGFYFFNVSLSLCNY